jgi:NAD(P)-dependent dehydrogenase (short-subunit alcohol dehydrogenase family)
MGQFDSKVLIVTGGGRGIGAATAEQFVHRGGRVVIGDISPDSGEKAAKALGDDRAVFQVLDVREPSSCQALVDRAVSEFGGVDYLVNSAIKMAAAPLSELKLEDWRTVIEVGLTGTFLMTQTVGRWLIANNRPGAVVNLSSMAGFQPYGASGAYSTVKAAVLMLGDHFAIEWARKGIRVNTVAPGHIETPLTAYLKDPVIKQGRADVTPLGRVGKTDDVVGGILFLLSDEARYITATHLIIDGGVTKSVFNHFPGRKWD